MKTVPFHRLATVVASLRLCSTAKGESGYNKVYVERAGKLELTELSFRDNQHFTQIIDRIVSGVGRRVDESSWWTRGSLTVRA